MIGDETRQRMVLHRTAIPRPRPSAFLVLALLSPLLPGCQLFGYVGAVLPPPKTKALYKPIDQKTLIFVDDPRHALPSPGHLGLLTRQAQRDLSENKAIAQFVPPEELDDLRRQEAEFDTWPIDRVGERLGARQVIYIVIDAFDPGGANQEVRRPTASARLKVVDVATGKRLFPERDEHGVSSVLYFKSPPAETDWRGREEAIALKLAQRLGEDIAKQFYDHRPREVGSGLKD